MYAKTVEAFRYYIDLDEQRKYLRQALINAMYTKNVKSINVSLAHPLFEENYALLTSRGFDVSLSTLQNGYYLYTINWYHSK